MLQTKCFLRKNEKKNSVSFAKSDTRCTVVSSSRTSRDFVSYRIIQVEACVRFSNLLFVPVLVHVNISEFSDS